MKLTATVRELRRAMAVAHEVASAAHFAAVLKAPLVMSKHRGPGRL